MAELTENLRSFWAGLDRRARTGLIVGAVLVVLAATVFWVWALKRDYQVLFKDLAQRDSATIVAELKRLKVPYRLDADGTTIQVPADAVHETRLSLMGRGVPLSGGVGFELFDNNDLSMTEYAQRINYQRALQGELARTIMSIEGVKLARVHLVLPDASIFKRDKGRPKASVSLVLPPGANLTESQILGVQRLVAASAPGLEPSMVTVLDQRGVALSYASEGAPGAAVGAQLRMKKEVEEYLTRKVAEVLDRSFGPGQALVSIDVALNFDEIRRTTQDVIPTGTSQAGVLVHKREVVQRQPRAPTVRVTDGEANLGARREDSFNSTVEANYEVGRHVEQVVTSPGSIRRISVGVVVPRTVSLDAAAQIQSLVAVAAGLDGQRGDAIVVHALDQMLLGEAHPSPASPDGSSARSASSKEPGKAPASGWDLVAPLRDWTLWVTAALGLVAGLALAFALRRLRRRRTDSANPKEESHRRALLTEITSWLREDKPARAGEARP